jgi:hypothetical protein
MIKPRIKARAASRDELDFENTGVRQGMCKNARP